MSFINAYNNDDQSEQNTRKHYRYHDKALESIVQQIESSHIRKDFGAWNIVVLAFSSPLHLGYGFRIKLFLHPENWRNSCSCRLLERSIPEGPGEDPMKFRLAKDPGTGRRYQVGQACFL